MADEVRAGGDATPGATVVSDPARPELGHFLRASRAHARGALVWREEPLFRVCGGPKGLPEDLAGAARAARAAGLYLPPEGSELLRRVQGPNPQSDEALLRGVLHFNSFAAGVGGRAQAVFANLARANHSCAPNCMVDGDEGTLRAIKNVEAGETLTVSYLDDAARLWPRDRRRRELSERWGFVCHCDRCDSALDDMRRFKACSECGGDMLVAYAIPGPGASAVSIQCEVCNLPCAEEKARELLQLESSMSLALERAQSGDMEEEDEGQELIRVFRFAVKHPMHSIALDLANDFAFPEPLPALQSVLRGLQLIFPDVPCQLALTTHRELARLHRERGDASSAVASEMAAADVACILDGLGDRDVVLQEWGNTRAKVRPLAPADRSAGLSLAVRPPDLDLDLGTAPIARHVLDNPAPSSVPQSGSGSLTGVERLPPPEPSKTSQESHMSCRPYFCSAMTISVAIVAVVFVRRRLFTHG